MKYWAYVNNEILGPFEKDKLRELPSFSASLLVCPQTPVGEKTEDWKEASTYPELAALAGGAQAAPLPEPAAQAVPEPSPQAAPEPAAGSFPQPAIETASIAFKPLTAAQSVEPVPPPSHNDGMADISVTRLGKAVGAAPGQAEPVAQSSSGFDPISLSQIVRRTEHPQAQEAPAQAPEGLSLEPRGYQSAPEPAPVPAPEPVAQAPAAPEIQAFTAPAEAPPPAAAQAPGAAPFSYDTAGLQNLLQRLDQISQTSATRKDIDSALDPVRFKLDQMGEVITSIKNSQFQREVMDKLAFLESSVGELKETMRGGAQPAAAPKLQEVTIERNSDTVFGVQPAPAPKPEEKPKPEPAKEPAAPEVKDQGSKPSRLVPALKKVFKFIMTLVLLLAVVAVGLVGLKNAAPEIFAKIPPGILSNIPYLGGPAAQPAAGTQQPQADPFTGEGAQPLEQAPEAQPQEQVQLTPEQQEEQRKASGEQAQRAQDRGKIAIPPEAIPEVIYITRTYKAKRGGQSLENMIYEHAGKAGGNYNRTNWEVLAADDGKFTVNAVIPAKGSSLTYTYLVDRTAKSVVPSNKAAQEAFAALSAPAARKATKPAGKKAAAKPAPKPRPAPKPAEDEEYEYVYEDEE